MSSQLPRVVATQGNLCFYVFLGSWILHHPLSFLWHVPCLSSFHPHLKYGNLTLEKESLEASGNHSQGFQESTKGGCSWLFQTHKQTSNPYVVLEGAPNSAGTQACELLPSCLLCLLGVHVILQKAHKPRHGKPALPTLSWVALRMASPGPEPVPPLDSQKDWTPEAPNGLGHLQSYCW